MALVAGGGDSSSLFLYWFLPRLSPPVRYSPPMKLGAMASWWLSSFSASHLSYLGALAAGRNEGDPFPASFSFLCSHPAKPIGLVATSSSCAASPFFGELVSDGFLGAGRMFMRTGCVWFGWYGRVLETVEIRTRAKPARIVWMWVFSPELVPVLYCCFTGVSSSLCVLSVLWAAGVGSGWCMSLFVSTGVGSGLLVDFFQCFIAGTVEHHGRSLELGLSPTPKGVRLIVPSGILKSLTVLVSWPANGGSFVHGCTSVLLWRRNNSCWAPNHDVFILVVYVSTVSVIVFLTLIIFHHIV